MIKKGSKCEILVLTHGKFGGELIKSAEVIMGKIDNASFIPLLPETSIEEYQNEVEDRLKNMPEGSLVLLDLFGGTPSNTVASMAGRYTVNAIAGVNLPMLLEAAMMIDQYEDGEMNEKLVEVGRSGCVDIIKQLSAL